MRTKQTTRKGRVLSVELVTRYDESPDTSYLGEYTDTADIDCIVCATGEFWADVKRRERIIDRCEELADDADGERAEYWRAKGERLSRRWEDVNEVPAHNREYRFFRPYAGGEEVGSKDWRVYAQQDYRRMQGLSNGQWSYIGVIAEAEVTLSGSDVVQRITSGGLWGVESDCGDDIADVEREELQALRGELEAIGFGKRAIAAALAKVERVNK